MDENSVAMNAERAVARGKAAGLDFVLRELDLGVVYLRMASNADTKSAQKDDWQNGRLNPVNQLIQCRIPISTSRLSRLGTASAIRVYEFLISGSGALGAYPETNPPKDGFAVANFSSRSLRPL